MIVCVCHRVSERDIAHAVRHGCGSFDELQDELRVATSCGACGDCARQTFDQHCAQTPCAMVSAWAQVSVTLTAGMAAQREPAEAAR